MLFTGTLAWIALANSKPVGGYSNDSVVMVAVPAGLGVFGAIVYVLLPFISKALVSGKVHTAGFNLLDAIVLTLLLLRKTKKKQWAALLLQRTFVVGKKTSLSTILLDAHSLLRFYLSCLQ